MTATKMEQKLHGFAWLNFQRAELSESPKTPGTDLETDVLGVLYGN